MNSVHSMTQEKYRVEKVPKSESECTKPQPGSAGPALLAQAARSWPCRGWPGHVVAEPPGGVAAQGCRVAAQPACDAPNFRGSFFFFFFFFFFFSYKSSMYFSYTYPKYIKLYCSNIFLQNANQGHNSTFFLLTASRERRLLVYLKGGSHDGVSKAQ